MTQTTSTSTTRPRKGSLTERVKGECKGIADKITGRPAGGDDSADPHALAAARSPPEGMAGGPKGEPSCPALRAAASRERPSMEGMAAEHVGSYQPLDEAQPPLVHSG